MKKREKKEEIEKGSKGKGKQPSSVTRSKKGKIAKTDGLGPYEIKKIRSAVRLVWHRSYARALVVKRCTDKDGFAHCEDCDKRTPALEIDHIVQVGEVDGGFLKRLFCPSSELQGLCRECHNSKTKAERKLNRPIKDFY